MKNIDDIQERLTGHLRSDSGMAVLLTGPRGCGKTYLWKNRITPALNDDRPIYVSLFGMDSSRADLVAVMDHTTVQRSEIAGDGCRFPS